MKKWMKIGLICMAVGALMFAGAAAVKGFDFRALAEAQGNVTEQTFEITEAFDRIEIRNSSGDIRVEKAQDGACRAVCGQSENYSYTVAVNEGVLKITGKSNALFGWIGLGDNSSGVCLYLPGDNYPAITIETASGNVEICEGLTFGDVDMSASSGKLVFRAASTGGLKAEVSSGDVEIGGSANSVDVECASGSVTLTGSAKDATVETTSGDVRIAPRSIDSVSVTTTSANITFEGVKSDSIRAGSTSGDVRFIDSDARKIEIHTTSGDVTGNLLTDKIFNIKTASGDVKAPRSVSGGGDCDIYTTSGDVDITVG